MTEWDAPNQQVVRADQSAPWEEGTGGSEAEPKTKKKAAKNAEPEAEPKAEEPEE